MLACISAFLSVPAAFLLRKSANKAVGAELSYLSSYHINFSVVFVYLTSYYFLGPMILLTVIQPAVSMLHIRILFVISIAVAMLVPFIISTMIYAAFIYDPETLEKVGIPKGFEIAWLNARVIIPVLLVIAVIHSFIPGVPK